MGELGFFLIRILTMCITPMIVCLVSLSVANFISKDLKKIPLRILLVLILLLFVSSSIGVISAIILTPGFSLLLEANDHLQKIVESSSQSSKSVTDLLDINISQSAIDLIFQSIPTNVFEALANNNAFKITVFAVIFGFSLGKVRNKESFLSDILSETRMLLGKIMGFVVHYLPLILILISAKQFSDLGLDQLTGMLAFIWKFYIAALILLITMSLIIKFRTHISVRQLFSIMTEPILVSISAQSPTTSLPSTIIAMRRLGYEENIVNIVTPLGLLFGKYDCAIYFGFCTIFAANIYGLDYNYMEYISIIFFTMLASTSTAGQGMFSSLTALTIILTPLNIPSAAILPLIYAVASLIDPARVLITVYTNCAAVCLTCNERGPMLTKEDIEKIDKEKAEEGENK